MNVLSAIGNISKDAEVRYLANGDPVCQFNFALNTGYGDKQITTWLNCRLWGKRAETLAPMLIKGIKIGISGELTNRPYTSKDGTEKYSLEVRVNDVTLLGKPTGESVSVPKTSSKTNEQEYNADNLPDDGFQDDIPF